MLVKTNFVAQASSLVKYKTQPSRLGYIYYLRDRINQLYRNRRRYDKRRSFGTDEIQIEE